ncbi:MAG: transglutaminase domain-containing protein [Pirellulales bacterium]|nr:transglutaminase domain-containing protein [Pirellulales bacterium]
MYPLVTLVRILLQSSQFAAWLSLLSLSCLVARAQDDSVGSKHRRVLEDTWEVIELGGSRAGYGRFRETSFKQQGETVRQIDSVTRLRLRRLGQGIEATIRVQMTSNASGEMQNFRTEANLGGAPTVTTGEVNHDRLIITSTQGGRPTSQEIGWGPNDHGFFYERTSLQNKPMVPGETRRFTSLLPIFHQLAETKLTAGKWSETKMLSETRKLLPIQSRTTLHGQQFDATLWMDSDGRILKTDEPTLGQRMIRVSRAEALSAQDAAPPDLIVGTLIPLEGNREGLSASRSATYRVKIKSGTRKSPFPDTLNQTCTPGSEKGSWVLTVAPQRERSTAVDRRAASAGPTAADRQSSRMIQLKDPLIRELAHEVPADATECRLAVELTRKVNTWIEQKDFSAALASAAEVASTRRGDCTEHAVLLAALARARGLPTRVVVGLVYVPAFEAFGYHMWNQIWCDGEWLDFDATRSTGRCGAGHIHIAATPLDDASGLTVFLPVLKVMGGTTIERIEDAGAQAK